MKYFRFTAVAAIAGLIVLASHRTTQAGSIVLGNSGWTASWASGFNGNLSLSVDNVGTNSVTVEKIATYNTTDLGPGGTFAEPKVVTFEQTSASAKPTIIVTDEQLTNNTGKTWTGFTHTILDGSTGTGSDTRFDVAATSIGLPGGFTINPFTTADFTQNDQILTVGGGTVPSSPPGSNTWFPGGGPNGGELAILAQPNASGAFRAFSLKEQPLISGGGGGPVAIPLPAAAWTGMSGLIGLALASSVRKLRNRMG